MINPSRILCIPTRNRTKADPNKFLEFLPGDEYVMFFSSESKILKCECHVYLKRTHDCNHYECQALRNKTELEIFQIRRTDDCSKGGIGSFKRLQELSCLWERFVARELKMAV